MDQHLVVRRADRGRSEPMEMVVGPRRRWPPLERELYNTPFLQYARDIIVNVQAGIGLQEEP
jgi:hypothetical protein